MGILQFLAEAGISGVFLIASQEARKSKQQARINLEALVYACQPVEDLFRSTLVVRGDCQLQSARVDDKELSSLLAGKTLVSTTIDVDRPLTVRVVHPTMKGEVFVHFPWTASAARDLHRLEVLESVSCVTLPAPADGMSVVRVERRILHSHSFVLLDPERQVQDAIRRAESGTAVHLHPSLSTSMQLWHSKDLADNVSVWRLQSKSEPVAPAALGCAVGVHALMHLFSKT
jgi:hypothetical protein